MIRGARSLPFFQDIMRIGILSDTHGLLRDEVVKALDGVDHIIHAGDIDRKEVIDSLESIAPATVVRGNADKDWAEHIPVTASIDLSGKRFYVIHNKAKIGSDLSGYDDGFCEGNALLYYVVTVLPGTLRHALPHFP